MREIFQNDKRLQHKRLYMFCEKRCWCLINSVIIINNLVEKLKRMSKQKTCKRKNFLFFSLYLFIRISHPYIRRRFLVFVFIILLKLMVCHISHIKIDFIRQKHFTLVSNRYYYIVDNLKTTTGYVYK